tara:strand:- start:595 stop:1032 length:438 start_codon:yes stop_codon:yes gene_type:complete
LKINKTKYVECAGGIIINNKQEIVIVNQNHDSWSLPKGHIDNGETMLEAAIREIYEETGITNPKLIKSIGSFGRYRIGLDGNDDKTEHKTIHIFLFHSQQKILKPIDQNNPIAKWVPYIEVEKILTHPSDKKFFNKSIKKIINEK